MKIEYLADHECHLSIVAAWQQSEFGYLNPSVTIAQRINRLRETLQRETLPVTLIAIDDNGIPIGAASVLPKTITHAHLTPWLSSVVVSPEYRGKGVASDLSLKAVEVAAHLGYETLHLFTPRNESLYGRIGWKVVERSIFNGVPITIMARSTSLTRQ